MEKVAPKTPPNISKLASFANLNIESEEEDTETRNLTVQQDTMPRCDFDILENLPHPYIPDANRKILVATIQFDGGHDMRTAKAFLRLKTNKIALRVKVCEDMKSARARLQKLACTGTVFSHQLVLVQQKRLNKQYEQEFMEYEFDLPPNVKVTGNFINPLTYAELPDPMTATSTPFRDELMLTGGFGTFFMNIAEEEERKPDVMPRQMNGDLFGSPTFNSPNPRKRRSPRNLFDPNRPNPSPNRNPPNPDSSSPSSSKANPRNASPFANLFPFP